MNTKIIQEDVSQILRELKKEIKKLEGENILITGANGMLASYIIYTLIYANESFLGKPVNIYLITRKKKKKFGVQKNLHYINCDISKKSPKIKNISFIIHAASKAAPKFYIQKPIDTINTNILGLHNLLKIYCSNIKSFLYFSSGEVYGSPTIKTPISETYIGGVDPINLRSSYIEGKRAGEAICMSYFHEKQTPVKIARIFHSFGPGLNLGDGRVFSDFVKMGLQKKNIEINGNPRVKRSFLYVADATIMFIKILLSDKNGEVYNVGNPSNTFSVKNVAEIVKDIFNKYQKQKIHVVIKKKNNKEYSNAVRQIVPDISKFIKDFNYVPKVKLWKAFERTIRYYL